jgi:hypothetical protein
MDRKTLGPPILALFAISCLVFNSSAHAADPEFLFKSKATGRCLHVQGGDEPSGGEVRVFDPCQTLPRFRVEVFNNAVLRIKLTPQNFKCLQVKQPIRFSDLPVKVTPGNCVGPSNWSLIPDQDLFMVVLKMDEPSAAVCMQEGKSGQVVVDVCKEDARWELEEIPQPILQPTPQP